MVLDGLDISVAGMSDIEILSRMAAECHKVVAAMARSESESMKRRGKNFLPEAIFVQNDDS
jgi:hypothetical protein